MHTLATSIPSHLADAGVPIAEKIIRTAAVYFALILLLRFVGKRTLAQLNPFDLVVLLLLSNVVQNAVIGNDNSLLGGVVGAVTLVVLNEVVVWIALHQQRLDRVLVGRGRTIIDDGRIDEQVVRHVGLNDEEVVEQVHAAGGDVRDVQRMTLLPWGKFEVLLKRRAQNATKADVERIEHKVDRLLHALQERGR